MTQNKPTDAGAGSIGKRKPPRAPKDDGRRRIVEVRKWRLGSSPCAVIPSRPFISLATLLGPVREAITEAHKVPHYMAIQYIAKAAFTEALEAYLDQAPIANDTIIYVDARTGEGADALPVLERRAGDVYRGV